MTRPDFNVGDGGLRKARKVEAECDAGHIVPHEVAMADARAIVATMKGHA